MASGKRKLSFRILGMHVAHRRTRVRLVRTCNSLSANTSLVRKGLGISAMPVDLVSDELASRELIALREQPPLPKVAYSAAYIPSNSFKIVPLIVAYAKEESRFSNTW
jgi:DNA-binding transcriptional LysR family regulator